MKKEILKISLQLVLFLSFLVSQSAFAGYIVAWGDNSYRQCDVPSGDDFTAIAAGALHSLALTDELFELRVNVEFNPAIIVTKPAGGEIWTSGSVHEIIWYSYGGGAVDILFSKDGGSSWQTIESGVADAGSCVLRLPDKVYSNQCVIKVVPSVPDSNVVCLESGIFQVHRYPGRPAAPPGRARKGNLGRGGLSDNYGPKLGCVKWRFETDGPVTAGVTIGEDGRVHIACEDGKLYTLDADGSLLWSYDTNSPLMGSAAAGYYGMVYVGSNDGRLYAIDGGGNVRWTHNTGAPIYSSPVVSANGNVYVCSEDGVLYALGHDGSELWSFETDGFAALGSSILSSPAISADGTVYIGGLYDPNLYALDANDGGVKWACNFEFSGDRYDPGWLLASPVIATDGTIYQTLLYDANLYAIEPSTGSIIWSTNLADPCSGWFEPSYYDYNGHIVVRYYLSDSGWSEPALGPDGTIYVSFDDGYLRAVDPNGSIKWVTRLGVVGGFTLTVGSDGLIYGASDDGSVCVVDANGLEIARFTSDDRLSFPVIAADNTMIVSDANNMIWAIGGQGCEGRAWALSRPQDLDTNRIVNFLDFALLAFDWLECADWQDWDCDYEGDAIYAIGDIDRDLYVNFADLQAIAERWLSED